MKPAASCEVCGKQRDPGLIHIRDSKIMKGQKLVKCDVCEQAGLEPRWLVIIVARTKGSKAVEDYIRHHKYVGKEIVGRELV